MRVGPQDALHLTDQRADLAIVDRAAGVDRHKHPQRLAFERIQIQPAADEAPVVALKIVGRLGHIAPEVRAPVEPRRFEHAQLAGQVRGQPFLRHRQGDDIGVLVGVAPVRLERGVAPGGDALRSPPPLARPGGRSSRSSSSSGGGSPACCSSS